MIKVVGFMGGVGNQLFQYCLYNSFQQKGNAVFFMDRTGQFASIHNGLEVNKYFDVNMRKSSSMALLLFASFCSFYYFNRRKLQGVCCFFSWLLAG